MKKLLNSIFLLILSISCFSQNSEKEKLNFTFIDECTNKIITPEFDIDSFPDLKNSRIITYYIKRGEWIGQNSITINLNKKNTVRIPRILSSTGNELHTRRWNYLNCNRICNGKETDFYSNGNKRLEGDFINGKPKDIKFYREDGIIETQEFYKLGTLNNTKINYFDNLGELLGFEKFKNKKKKTIIRRYDKNGKLLKKHIIKKYIENNK